MNIPYPALYGTTEEQLAQLKSYLYQTADLLNYNFNNLFADEGSDASSSVEKNGVWEYRKWNSGIIELWTKGLTHTVEFESVSSSLNPYPLYYSPIDNIKVPLVTEIIFVSADSMAWRYANWSSATVKGDKTSISIRYYGTNKNGDGETLEFKAYVIGKWK